MMKKCRKCGEEKPIEDYYVHPQMSDGHLNICKECTKRRIRNRSLSLEGREYDKKRNQMPKRKAWLKQYLRKRRKANKKKWQCSTIMWHAINSGELIKPDVCSECGTVDRVPGHHEDYSKPLEVIWLCGKCHRKRHKQYQRIDD